jgi:hypothetical protein
MALGAGHSLQIMPFQKGLPGAIIHKESDGELIRKSGILMVVIEGG